MDFTVKKLANGNVRVSLTMPFEQRADADQAMKDNATKLAQALLPADVRLTWKDSWAIPPTPALYCVVRVYSAVPRTYTISDSYSSYTATITETPQKSGIHADKVYDVTVYADNGSACAVTSQTGQGSAMITALDMLASATNSQDGTTDANF